MGACDLTHRNYLGDVALPPPLSALLRGGSHRSLPGWHIVATAKKSLAFTNKLPDWSAGIGVLVA
jgi:hypothetical protein